MSLSMSSSCTVDWTDSMPAPMDRGVGVKRCLPCYDAAMAQIPATVGLTPIDSG